MNNNILIFVNIGRSCSPSQNTMPAIDRVIGNRIVYNQTELKYVLQQLHRHRRKLEKYRRIALRRRMIRKGKAPIQGVQM